MLRNPKSSENPVKPSLSILGFASSAVGSEQWILHFTLVQCKWPRKLWRVEPTHADREETRLSYRFSLLSAGNKYSLVVSSLYIFNRLLCSVGPLLFYSPLFLTFILLEFPLRYLSFFLNGGTRAIVK